MVIHATDMENVNTARMASATTALRLQRAIISKAKQADKGHRHQRGPEGETLEGQHFKGATQQQLADWRSAT